MGKNEAGIILIISILIFSFAVLTSILEMRQELEAQNAQVRQIKTDGEIILRLVAGGDFSEEEK